ncbi:hypothetical protein [Fluviispira multicolorata]|uniref:Uncharacterized protein n=1 Tax=Fluviispira multicolorata TaxID=2654512 RepID=A0A833JHV9_9BACT|nr:hypothetical protein [Fluviispira multicolorata]KAB8033672.1 hypothetical protein GCL57_02905 [Fluviispira multicolorata]
MTINIISWAYNQESSKDIILNKTNCGHAAFEILMVSKNFKKLLKNTPMFKDIYIKEKYIQKKLNEVVNKYDPQYKDMILLMSKKWNSSFEKCLSTEILKECQEIYEINKVVSNFKNILPKRVYHGKEKYVSLYFSFWPGDDCQSATKETFHQKNIALKVADKGELRDLRDNMNNSFQKDMEDEADGVDISKLFSDLKMNNLEKIDKIHRKTHISSSWGKKEKLVYKVKSGILKGMLVTSATYSEYQSLTGYFLNRKKFSHRLLLLNQFGDINKNLGQKESSEYTKTITQLSTCIKSIDNDIRDGIINNVDDLSISKLNELKRLLEDEHLSLQTIYNSNKLAHGLSPSHIISLPSQGLEGFGLDESKILETWFKYVHPSGYSFTSTNCSWAVMRALSPETNKFKAAPLRRSLTPITPKEVAHYFSEVQDCMFKRFSQEINNLNRNSFVPEKKLWTVNEFKQNTPGSGTFGLFKEANRYSSSNIKQIEELIASYHRIANYQINWRLKCLDQLADCLSTWFEDKFDAITNKKSTRYNGIKSLLNQIALEREYLIEHLLY